MATIERIDLPTLSPGTQRHIQVRRYGRPGARPKAYIQASVHADEMPGVFCVHHLTPLLEAAERDGAVTGEIVVAPFANPIGLTQDLSGHHYGRFDLTSRENFNRGYPWLGPKIFEKVGDELGADAAANVALIREAALACLAETRATTEFDHLRIALMTNALDADLSFDLHSAGEATLYIYCDSDPGGERIGDARRPDGVARDLRTGRHGGRAHLRRLGRPDLAHRRRPDRRPGDTSTERLPVGDRRAARHPRDRRRGHVGRCAQPVPFPAAPGHHRRRPRSAAPAALPAAARFPPATTATRPAPASWYSRKASATRSRRARPSPSSSTRPSPTSTPRATAVASGAAGLLFDRQGDRFARAGDCIFRIAADAPLAHREGLSPLDG